jgi:hypothetical protein
VGLARGIDGEWSCRVAVRLGGTSASEVADAFVRALAADHAVAELRASRGEHREGLALTASFALRSQSAVDAERHATEIAREVLMRSLQAVDGGGAVAWALNVDVQPRG